MSRLVSRRLFVGSAAAAGCWLSSSSAAASQIAAASGAAAENPLGNRWPDPSERYFYGRAARRDEMAAAAARIRPGDVQGYERVWSELARENEDEAERQAVRGHPITARTHLLRASNYHSQVQNLSLRIGDGQRLRAAEARMVSAFRRAWSRTPSPFEVVSIPFGETAIPGFFFPAEGARGVEGPAVLELSGIDHIKERAYFRSHWIPFTQRGFHYLSIDAPGQGEMLAGGSYLRPDSEAGATAALAYLRSRPDVDPDRVGVFATSFGGYFGPRAAAADPRLRALACRSAVFDAAVDAFDYCPWIREQLRLLVNARTLAEARSRLEAFTLAGVASRIRCPVFVSHGSQDDIVSVEAAHKLAAAIPDRHSRVVIVDGARHNPGETVEIEQIDWMVEQLA